MNSIKDILKSNEKLRQEWIPPLIKEYEVSDGWSQFTSLRDLAVNIVKFLVPMLSIEEENKDRCRAASSLTDAFIIMLWLSRWHSQSMAVWETLGAVVMGWQIETAMESGEVGAEKTAMAIMMRQLAIAMSKIQEATIPCPQ